MKTDRPLPRGQVFLLFARRFSIAGAVVLLAAFSNNLAQGYPQGPEAPDDGFYAADLPLPPLIDAGMASQWVDQLPGDLTSQLPSMTAADSASDPFDNPSDLGGGSPSDSNWLVPYDGTHTNETYLGDPLATGAGDAHVGLDLGAVDSASWASVEPSSQYYADSSGNPLVQFPAVGAFPVPPTPPGGNLHYLIMQWQAATPGGPTVGEWFELPYHGAVPQVELTAGANGFSLSNIGFMLSDTQIPLDQLNLQDYPAPGSPSSPFTSLPEYQGSMINGGGNMTVTLPEPGSLALVIVGGLIVTVAGGYRRCRRAS